MLNIRKLDLVCYEVEPYKVDLSEIYVSIHWMTRKKDNRRADLDRTSRIAYNLKNSIELKYNTCINCLKCQQFTNLL